MDVATHLLEHLSAPDASQVRLRLSWHDYLALPKRPRAEWVDGEVVVSPPVGPAHGLATAELIVTLKSALPGLFVMGEVGVRLPGDRLRAPDLTVTSTRPASRWVEDAPILVVEVLSCSTRDEDLLRKGPEYAAAGVGQYWVVDPEARTIEVSENLAGAWRLLFRLDDGQPTGRVRVGEHGVVPLDLGAVLGPVEG